MKKALSVFLMAAMAFGAFADEPVADVNVAEFSGNAAVTWGVDLDSGTTGFQNSTEVNLKLNLLNGGTKSTTGDGVWGELVIKTDGDTFVGWNNTTKDDSANKGMKKDLNLGVKVDTAKIHFGPAYVGITSGDTQTGELKLDAAIRSADKDEQSKWLDNVGPDKYSQGIVAGYDSDMFKVDLDLRSKPTTKAAAQRLVAYISKGEAKYVAPRNVEKGDVIHYSDGSTYTVTANDAGTLVTAGQMSTLGGATPNDYIYTDNYAFALEGEFKGVENLSVKAGVSYNFAKNYQANKTNEDKTLIPDPQHTLGYSASAGYKLALNDTFFVRPQVGFAGDTTFKEDATETKTTESTGKMAFGVLFGWGDISQDKNAGVYYLDDNMAKKVTPGVGVVAYIPFASTKKTEPKSGNSTTVTTYDEVAARIMPSFYSGEIVPGLTAAAYADIVVPKTGKSDNKTTYKAGDKKVTAMAFTLGAKYALNVEEMTITPQIGLRFANAAYVDYGDTVAEKGNAVFAKMGDQKKKDAADENGIISDGNYMNLKFGVDVAGLIDNTTLSVNWATDNILNAESTDTENINKFGTLNFKAKIAL
ncbi:MAG: autotransporter [Treponema sp.]|nr:autotransporter [Treponema sp.]